MVCFGDYASGFFCVLGAVPFSRFLENLGFCKSNKNLFIFISGALFCVIRFGAILMEVFVVELFSMFKNSVFKFVLRGQLFRRGAGAGLEVSGGGNPPRISYVWILV